MLFPTVDFAIFFVVVFVVSWLLMGRHTGRKLFLVLASYFFYAYWDVRFTLLLLGCSLGAYVFGLMIDAGKNQWARKSTLTVSLAFFLGILGFFKYYAFFAVSVNNAFLRIGWTVQAPILSLVLPVGISFYTFQAMSYVIGVYRRDTPPCRSVPDILLYISFFPQLVAGPIVRARQFLPQLHGRAGTAVIRADRAILRISAGLFKKVIIAHYLATLLVDDVFADPSAFSTLELLAGIYGYAVQIYCDFSAYSDIAIGVAGLLGFSFPDNFARPYRASSPRDFWRRWHISLSAWLRDYIYIPLGGSRRGRARTLINLMITMLLGGLWHGAAWRFVAWGALHGLGLCIGRIGGKRPTEGAGAGKKGGVRRAVSIFLTFHFVCIGWVFFRAPSFSYAFEYFRALGNVWVPVTRLSPFIVLLIGIGLGMHFIPDSWRITARRLYRALPLPAQGLLAGIILTLVSALSGEGVAPFIYFQF